MASFSLFVHLSRLRGICFYGVLQKDCITSFQWTLLWKLFKAKFLAKFFYQYFYFFIFVRHLIAITVTLISGMDEQTKSYKLCFIEGSSKDLPFNPWAARELFLMTSLERRLWSNCLAWLRRLNIKRGKFIYFICTHITYFSSRFPYFSVFTLVALIPNSCPLDVRFPVPFNSNPGAQSSLGDLTTRGGPNRIGTFSSVSPCLFVCLSVCLSVWPSYLSVCLSVWPSYLCLFCLFVCLSFCLSLPLSFFSLYLSIYLSRIIHPSNYLTPPNSILIQSRNVW